MSPVPTCNVEKLLIGIVNKALESFVEEALGAEILRKAKVKAGLEQVSFSVTQAYPDADTYTLLGAVCEVGGIEASDALEGFGRFWIRFAESHGYGPLMDSAGSDFIGSLRGLEMLHTRVSLMFPGAVLPAFSVVESDSSSATLMYRSSRPLMGPFVLGTLHGLAERHQLSAEITRHVLIDADGHHEERFELSWVPRT